MDRLHILGTSMTGARGDTIIDVLMDYHSVDITWATTTFFGWGSGRFRACVANVIRMQARYDILDVLEDSYGINLMPWHAGGGRLFRCRPVQVHARGFRLNEKSESEIKLTAMMHKAIAIIQFKVEGQLIADHPEYHMDDRRQLHLVDYEKGTITLGNTEYVLNDRGFPTIDPLDPYRLTEQEEYAIGRLTSSFEHSKRMDEHIRFLFTKGAMYLIFNGNLLFHGGIPLEEDGSFMEVEFDGESFTGKAAFDKFEQLARSGYFNNDRWKEDRPGYHVVFVVRPQITPVRQRSDDDL